MAALVTPSQEHAFRRGPRVVAIETVIPDHVFPGLLLLRVQTDAGTVAGDPVIGHGETYYAPHGVAAILHDWMARRLLGADALAIESHWRFLYERATAFGGTGAELRALSAIDLALWDVLGQLTRQPIWRLLGGPVRDRIPVYHSCGGPLYGGRRPGDAGGQGWPGHGDPGRPGPLEDNWRSRHEPGDLAEELLAAGYRAMKLWSFDEIYQRQGGLQIRWEDVDYGLAPFRAIRERVGRRMELMLDGHGFFALPAALRIAQAMREIEPLWLEDVLRPDAVETMAVFRERAGVPIAVSEMVVLRDMLRQVLDRRAADYVMIDPTWVGGISETRRMAELAQLHNLPVLMHDCTGPLTLFAGLHVSAAVPAVTSQETVRAHMATVYPQLIDEPPVIQDGHIALPERPGLGVRLRDDLFDGRHPQYRITRL
uniref:Mandelate racemase/muconate lactonizing enzyme family protein n=1 Tax=Schlesneria paludicola TaxID=360056 RepID=A0A7C4QNT3_9PLAN